MADGTDDQETALPEGGRIQPHDIREEMQSSYLTYAMSVIISRALPDVRDGLKTLAAAHSGRHERPESRAVVGAQEMREDRRRYERQLSPAR